MNALLTPLLAGSTIEFMFPFNAQNVWDRFAAPFVQSSPVSPVRGWSVQLAFHGCVLLRDISAGPARRNLRIPAFMRTCSLTLCVACSCHMRMLPTLADGWHACDLDLMLLVRV